MAVQVRLPLLSYLNEPTDKELSARAMKEWHVGWSRDWALKGEKNKAFVSAMMEKSPTTDKYARKSKKLSTLVTNDWTVATNDDNKIYAIGWVPVTIFAKAFGFTEPAEVQAAVQAYPNGYPVFIYGTAKEISNAMRALGLVNSELYTPEDFTQRFYLFLDAVSIVHNYVLKGKRKTDEMYMNPAVVKRAPEVVPTIEKLLNVAKVAAGPKKEKREWTARDLDRILFVSANLGLTEVISVNDEAVGQYGGKLRKPIENIFTNRLKEFEKSDTYEKKKATSVFNISNYTQDEGFSVRMAQRPKTTDVIRSGAQPVPFVFKHGEREYAPGFITTDNVEALEFLLGEMESQPHERMSFIGQGGASANKASLVNAVSVAIKTSEKQREGPSTQQQTFTY